MPRLNVADLWSIHRLQGIGIRLDVRGAILEPDPPLYLALWNSLTPWRQRVLTVVRRRGEGERRQAGFVQLHRRGGEPAMDVVFIAPALSKQTGSTWLWKHLLSDAVRVAGDAGAQRVFAHLPESRHAEVEVLRQAGFALYAQDRLYRLPAPPEWPAQPKSLTWQPQTALDEWNVSRLYYAITPAVVQQAETLGNTAQSNGDATLHCWGDTRKGCYVLRKGDRVFGYLRLTPGKHGHWLKIVLHPEISDRGERLVREALSLFRGWPKRPIFSDVREYEGYLTDGLERCGFRRVMVRRLLVHHTTVMMPAVEQTWTSQRIERAVKRAPTVSSTRLIK